MRAGGRRSFAAFLLSVSAAACAAVFGIEPLQDGQARDASAPGDTADVSTSDAAAERGICPTDLQPPDVPPVSTPNHVYLALSSLRPGPVEPDRQGLDVDCTDSRGPATSSCSVNLTDASDVLAEIVTDKRGGIDNAAQVLMFGAQGKIKEFTDANEISRVVLSGRSGLVFDVENLVDADDQRSIRIGAWPGVRVLDADELSCPPPGAGRDAGPSEPSEPDAGDGGSAAPPRVPQFNDRWCVDGESWTQLSTSEYASDAAWVRSRQLLAHFPRLAVPISYDVLFKRYAYARLDDVWLVADLGVDAAGHVTLGGGTLGGRWSAHEVLNETASIGASGPECRVNSLLFRGAQNVVCASRDLGTAEHPDVCSALSVGMSFTAYEVASKPAPTDVPTYQQRCRKSGYLVDDTPPAVDGFDCP